jgi:hypothetical protein
MSFPTSLTNNEVKDHGGTEVEFSRIDTEGRKTVLAKVGEAPNLKHRLTTNHSESGTGINRRRRSMVRVDVESISTVDSVTPVNTAAVFYVDMPVGAVIAHTEAKRVMAEVLSFLAMLGHNMFLYDGTGAGSVILLDGAS